MPVGVLAPVPTPTGFFGPNCALRVFGVSCPSGMFATVGIGFATPSASAFAGWSGGGVASFCLSPISRQGILTGMFPRISSPTGFRCPVCFVPGSFRRVSCPTQSLPLFASADASTSRFSPHRCGAELRTMCFSCFWVSPAGTVFRPGQDTGLPPRRTSAARVSQYNKLTDAEPTLRFAGVAAPIASAILGSTPWLMQSPRIRS